MSDDKPENPETPETPEGGAEAHDHDHDHGHDHSHSHDHDHGHSHDDVFHPELGAEIDSDELDPANRSLAEALSISFNVLRIVMIALIVWWVAVSGSTNVEDGYVGIRLWFGQVYGEPGQQVLEPGGPHFGLPDPLGRFIMVPTRPQTVKIDEAFWFWMPPDVLENQNLDQMVSMSDQDLRPDRDGSLITGDKNIVHGRWSIEYKVNELEAVDFVRNIGLSDLESDTDETGEQLVRDPMYRAHQFVRSAAEQVIVREVARVTVDDFVLGEIDKGRIQTGIQNVLDENDTGLLVTQVLVENFTAPLRTREAFKKVSEAESDQAQNVEIAYTEASKILNGVAGSGYGPLLGAINDYEAVRRVHGKDTPEARAADARISALLEEGQVEGAIATVIAEAVAYRSRAKEDIRAEADTFRTLLPRYLANPKIVMDRSWQDTFQHIMSRDVEVMYMSSDPNQTLYLELNRDPRIQKRREMMQVEAQAEAMDN
ncbi:MAG: SPFH domain-containing protein [Planctomycetota bacterium]|jgi:regulator of protease activity HflC (stomatin/prohibitin superfamily)